MLREQKILRKRAHPYIEQATMTGVSAAPTTAVSVVDNIKHVWYVVVDVIAGGSSRFVVLVAPNAEGAKNIEDTSASVHRASSDNRQQYFTDISSRCRGRHQTNLESCRHLLSVGQCGPRDRLLLCRGTPGSAHQVTHTRCLADAWKI